MLEKVKEVLITQKQELLKKKKHIEQEYEELQILEKKESYSELDQELEKIENEIENLKSGFMNGKFHNKKIRKLYAEYVELAQEKNNQLKKINRLKDRLLQELYQMTHDEFLVEEEIKRIRKAKTLVELGLTEEQGKKLLDSYYSEKGYSIIQNVFLDNQYITTKEEIIKSMQNLYQTNSSQFVLAMNEITLDDLIKELQEAEITLEEERVTYLKQVLDYINQQDFSTFPEGKQEEDEIENYYYNHTQKIVDGLKKYNSNKVTVKSYLMSLTVLTSIAKQNEKSPKSK